ncbi:MAG: hypothetical protein LBR98_00540 [Syntrophomonadaceae bacterium]|nr:hypothetical protein [Syntrophomonadaceae bacterium]
MKQIFGVCVSLILIALLVVSCSSKSGDTVLSEDLLSEGKPLTSPSGSFVVKIFELDGVDASSYMIKITSTDGVYVYEPEVVFRKRDVNLILWADDKTDTLWAYNSDLGTYIFVCVDGKWTETTYVENQNMIVPQKLKDLRPRIFK